MRHVIRMLCLLSAWGLVGLASTCAEDWPGYEVAVIPLSGGVIAPASPQENIRMDSMEINILPQTSSYVVDAVFHLFNTGEATTEWVGFPKHCMISGYIFGSHRKLVIRDFIRFEGWVNGRKELFEEKRRFLRGDSDPLPKSKIAGSSKETRWMAKKIAFPKNALTTVRIRYEALYYICKNCSLSGEKGHFYLGPGQYWKGNITMAEIAMENPDEDGKHRRLACLEPGTTLCKKTVTKTRTKIELRQVAPLANGYLKFGHIPDS